MSNDHACLLQVEAKLERARSRHASLESDIAQWELQNRDEVEARALINGTKYEYRVVKMPTMPALR